MAQKSEEIIDQLIPKHKITIKALSPVAQKNPSTTFMYSGKLSVLNCSGHVRDFLPDVIRSMFYTE